MQSDYQVSDECIWNPGEAFDLDETVVYPTYSSNSTKDTRTGRYYLYDTVVKDGKVRLTKTLDGVGKPCRSAGWFKVYDLKMLGYIRIGDPVIATGTIFKYSNGTGGYIELDNNLMYVVNMLDPEQYPYPYGLASGPNLSRKGWANSSILKKVKNK